MSDAQSNATQIDRVDRLFYLYVKEGAPVTSLELFDLGLGGISELVARLQKGLDLYTVASMANLRCATACLAAMSAGFVPVGEILTRNIAKLNKRYGDKFDAYLAVNRDLNKEAEALKGTK